MTLPVFTGTTDVDEFVITWSQFYDYGNEETYQTVITKDRFMPKDLELLFTWKSNTGQSYLELSRSKRAFVEKIKTKLGKVNDLLVDFDISTYRKHFDDLPAVWGVLLLHAINPDEFPIFNQHVYRSYTYLTTGTLGKLSASRKRNYEVYYGEYCRFSDGLYANTKVVTRKKLDEALWAFGRFLSKSRIIQPTLTS